MEAEHNINIHFEKLNFKHQCTEQVNTLLDRKLIANCFDNLLIVSVIFQMQKVKRITGLASQMGGSAAFPCHS